MTQNDCDNSKSYISIETLSLTETGSGESIHSKLVRLVGEIDKTIWDQALASADDALVLVQWLESKRS